MESADTLQLNVHGARARIACADAETRAKLADDFSVFVAPIDGASLDPPDVDIVLHRAAPNFDNLPPLTASVHTPRNVCYTHGDITYIDYGGKALAVYDRRRQRIEVWCARPHLLHEIAYLTLLSRLGEALERRGLHRVHALAVGAEGRSAVVLLPSTGGKTTLALHFLRSGVLRLVSEDSPLVDRRGHVYPFPLRIGVLADDPPDVPPEFVTYVERMEFAPKYLVSLRAFPSSIDMRTTTPTLLLIGRRTLGRVCRITPASRRAGFRALVRDMIVGVGLYQGVEFLLRTSIRDLATKTPIVAGRIRAALALLARVRVFEVELGRDLDTNAETLSAFFREQGLFIADQQPRPSDPVPVS
jgi:hypothetical protein